MTYVFLLTKSYVYIMIFSCAVHSREPAPSLFACLVVSMNGSDLSLTRAELWISSLYFLPHQIISEMSFHSFFFFSKLSSGSLYIWLLCIQVIFMDCGSGVMGISLGISIVLLSFVALLSRMSYHSFKFTSTF